MFFILELSVFFVILREFIDTKESKIIAMLLFILYAAGYPLNFELFSFYYAGMGGMLVSVLFLLIKYFRERTYQRKQLVFGMMLVCNAIAMSYAIYAPFIFIVLLIDVAQICYVEKVKIKKWISLCFSIFLIPTLLTIYYCYIMFLQMEGKSAFAQLQVNGGIYGDLFINFSWFILFIFYAVIRMIKNKKTDDLLMFFLGTVGLVGILLIAAVTGALSQYYFYKFYYILWTFSLLMAYMGIKELWKKEKEIVVSVGVIFSIMFIVSFGGIEERIVQGKTGLQLVNRSDMFFDIYRFNCAAYLHTEINCSDEYIDSFAYVMSELQSEKSIPIITTLNNYEVCYWYEAITGESCDNFEPNTAISNMIYRIENHEIDYFVVPKDSSVYREHQEFFDKFDRVYDKETIMICLVK